MLDWNSVTPSLYHVGMGYYFENQVEGICFASTRIGKVLDSEDTKCPRNLKLYHSESLQNVFLQLDFWNNNIPAKYSKPRNGHANLRPQKTYKIEKELHEGTYKNWRGTHDCNDCGLDGFTSFLRAIWNKNAL